MKRIAAPSCSSNLDLTVGHEQRGVRPCIAVSRSPVNADQRFPLIAVVPVIRTPGEGRHERPDQPSFTLIDRLRSVD